MVHHGVVVVPRLAHAEVVLGAADRQGRSVTHEATHFPSPRRQRPLCRDLTIMFIMWEFDPTDIKNPIQNRACGDPAPRGIEDMRELLVGGAPRAGMGGCT
ncbi:hypothetical protein HU200_026189 [Digitaria exilis]|uniref:Uncharacterized protein n=1 Tax=Digitaria exilis TaxID=1010633 RepID=A0A835BWA4_9POAL|nr:hypothetical protein HU200_026189 [Digitaria exilis]